MYYSTYYYNTDSTEETQTKKTKTKLQKKTNFIPNQYQPSDIFIFILTFFLTRFLSFLQ